MGWEKRGAPKQAEVAEPVSAEIALPQRPAPRLVSSNPPSVSLIEYAAGALTRKPGAQVEFDDFYLAYWQHCQSIDGRALAPTDAVEQTNKLCAECGITIRRRGKKRFLVGVRLKTRAPVAKAIRAGKKTCPADHQLFALWRASTATFGPTTHHRRTAEIGKYSGAKSCE
jgi:hypothetical protein